MSILRRLPYAFFLSLDLLASAMTFGAPWQTISARLGRAREQGSPVGTVLADALDRIVLTVFREPNHCTASLLAYEERAAAVD